MQPWEMKISLIWEPPQDGNTKCGAKVGEHRKGGRRGRGSRGYTTVHLNEDEGEGKGAPLPANAKVWGPKRGVGWATAGITVDEDTLPHILTFTAMDYHPKGKQVAVDAAAAAAPGDGSGGCNNNDTEGGNGDGDGDGDGSSTARGNEVKDSEWQSWLDLPF